MLQHKDIAKKSWVKRKVSKGLALLRLFTSTSKHFRLQ